MATTFSSGGQSTSHHRTIERVFEDAQHTGEINLSGRKLREYPKISTKYDLADTSVADLSKNRLGEIPKEICEYPSLERLNCYHNVIKVLPEALKQLQNLTHLCISRNQLTVIPSFIKQLHGLEVLIASHNRLVSLPEEIGELKRLMEIDVSCNEISHLPVQIGDLKSLRSLNVRRNLLVELPLEISKLHLRKLDFSCNKIAVIPTIFRKIETLEEFILDHNPLTLPPAFVCLKGKQHIMKYLQIEAIREDRKRGILNETEMKRLVRKSLPPQNSISSEEFRNMIDSTSPENKWKRHTVLSSDSGYSTTDSIEKCGVWSPSEELQRQKSDYERKKKQAEQIRLQQEEEDKENRRLAAQRLQEAQQAEIAKQREEFRLQEEARIQEERRIEEAKRLEEARLKEEERLREEARLAEEQRQKEDAKRQAESNQHYHYQGWQTSERYSPSYVSSSHVPSNHGNQIFSSAASSSLSPTYGGHQVVSRGYSPGHHGHQPAHVSRSPASPFYSPDHENYRQNYSNQSRPYETSSHGMPGYAPNQRDYSVGMSGYRSGQNGYTSGSVSYSPGYSTGSGHSPGAYSPTSPSYSPNVANEPSEDPNQRLTNYHQEFQHLPNDRNMVDNYDMRYRNPVQSSQSFNSEDKKPSISTPYRRTASDSVKKSTNVATSRSNQAKHTPSRSIPVLQRKTVSGTMNGKSPSSPGISPSPSPRSSVGSTGPSPASSTSSLHKTGVNTAAVVRRTKVTDRVATTPSSRTTPGSERHGRASTSSSTGAPSTARTPTTNSTSGLAKKNHLTPEEEYRQKHPGMRNAQPATNDRPPVGRLDDNRLKPTQKDTINNFVPRKPALSEEERKRSVTSTARTTNYNNRRSGGVMSSSSTMKVIDSYKDSESNYTLRRQEEKLKDEADQLDRLRKTIESKLKVTLPDNLPETLRDGVLLCQLANSIRPRAVTSIHVPSQAVNNKLTLAKCRKNVENFLEACRKIGVQREQMCGAQDILEEKGIGRVAVTIATLVSLQAGPRGSTV